MPKKRLFGVVSILLALLVGGCKGMWGGGTEGPIIGENIYTGTDGLDMVFLKESMPNVIFEKSRFTSQLLIQNKGAYNIREGYLRLEFDEYLLLLESAVGFTLPTTRMADDRLIFFDLKGKTVVNPQGDKEILTIKAQAQDIPEGSPDTVTTSLVATACYPYQTKATATVCIDASSYTGQSKKIEKPCTVREVSLSSQGAPIAVTRIIPTMLAHETDNTIVVPQFIIEITNKGKGKVFELKGKETPREICTNTLPLEDVENRISIKASLSGGRLGEEGMPLECGEESRVRLEHNQGTIVCTLSQGISTLEGTYLSPLSIRLDYGYMDTEKKDITLKKVLK